ncbi:RNA binding protein MEX3B, partial [Fasciola hepatica]
MRVAQHLTTRAQEITQSKLSAGERRRGSTSSQVNGLDPSGNACGLLTTTNGNCYNTNGGGNGSGCVVGSAHSNSCGGGGGGLLAPNGVCLGSNATGNGGPSSLLSLSVTNSPLHSSAAGGGSSLISTSANGGSTRVACSGLFSSHLSSLPNSPCSGSNGGSNGFPGHGQSSLFLSNGNGMMLGPGGTGANGGSSMLNSSSSTQSGSRVLLARSRISVPQEMVGKIIGTQGSIITTIQKDTGTEIKSPPKEAARGPNATSEFEISAYQGLGLSSNQAAECRVQQAKQLIGHLVMRQLERRASEEIEDNSGCANLNLNSDDSQRFGTASGTPRSVGSVGNGNGSNSGSSNGIPGWMWPDVAQMDSQEAREVLDRILAESKNKTRRAKELAAAAAAASPGSACTGGGPSPTSNGTISALNMVGCMSAQNSGYGNSSSDQSHSSSSGPSLSSPHQRFHAPSQLLVPSVSNFMDPSGSGEASDYHGSDTVGIFNPHSNSHYGSRGGCLNSLNLLGDDMSQLTNCNTSGNHMCSPRGLHGFNMGDPNDLSSSSSGLSRAPGTNLGAELWNPLSVFNGSDNSVMPPSMQPFLGSGSHVNSLFTTSAPPPNAALPHHLSTTTNPGCDGLNGLGASKTALSTDFHDCTNNSSMFNLTDALGTQFASANGDLSPTLLMHLRAQQQQQPRGDLSRQPLTRRHSDWVVNPNQLMSSDQSSMMRPHTATNIATSRHVTLSEHRLQQFALSGRSDSDNVGSPSSTTDTSVTTGPVHFGPGSPHLDLIKALDQLCLHSNVDPVSTCSGNSPNGSSSLPHCPPGFEHQPGLSSQSLSSSPQQQQSHQTPVSTTDSLYSACSVKPTDPDCFVPSTASVNNNDTHHPTDVWSTNVCDTTGSNTQFILNAQAVCTTTTSSLSAMHALSPTDYLGPSGFGKNSLLRRLFPSPNIGLEPISAAGEEEEVALAAAAKTPRLNAIWPQT